MAETNNKCSIQVDVKHDNTDPSMEITYGEATLSLHDNTGSVR